MPARRGLLAPQNTFLDTIATRFDGTHSNFVLGNAQVPSLYPIVYCSDGFCELTGYARAQIMQKGCACKFLYGLETLDDNKMAIDKALESKSELKIEVMFYKKNSTPFWCLLDIVPIKNEKREVVLFLASHKDVTHNKMAEIEPYSSVENDEIENLDPEAPPTNYGRRRSRAVLYQLSGHYMKQDNNIKSKLKINNNILQPHSTGPLPEYKTTTIKKSRLILTHYGMFKTCWDLIILLATIYVAVTVPYNASFLQDKPTLVPDMVVEALFIVDILLNFRTTFVNKKGEVILCPRQIAWNYLRGWFFLDLIAAMPFDMLLAANKLTDAQHPNIYMLKLTRLLRLLRLLQKMDRYSQYSAFILTLLMLFFTLVAHWLACIWYSIAEREMEIEKTSNITDEYRGQLRGGWVFELAERYDLTNTSFVGTTEKYITALYFTCSSLTSVGFGNVSANTKNEKIFAIATMLIGALMHATVFGNVTSIIQRMYSRRSLYQTKWRDLKDFLTLNQIPKELKHRMQDYFQTMWSLNQGIDSHETLKEFPEELRGDISMHIHREILSLPIFENAAQGCLKLLSLHIRNNFCAPGEYLVHKGDAIQYIYYLCNGSMEVVMDDMVVAILGKGDLVGSDIDMHLQNGCETIVKSSCDVKALTYCDLKSVNIPGLVDVLKLYLEYQQEFAHDIKHDLTHNLREGYDSEEKDFDIISGKNLLPSISEDDEERGSDEEDRSPVSTSPRSPLHPRTPNRFNFIRNEDDTPSPRWNQRHRERSKMSNDRLKALSPTRLHRSTDELRGDNGQAKVQLEKIDSQFSTLHSDVNLLTHEVRSAVQLLQNLNRDSQDLLRGSHISNIGGRDSISVSGRVQHSISGVSEGKQNYVRGVLPVTRSSPSVFISHDEVRQIESNSSATSPTKFVCPAPPSTPCSFRNYRHASSQTDLPVNVPIAVLEAFVLSHRSRVMQLLGFDDPMKYNHSNKNIDGSLNQPSKEEEPDKSHATDVFSYSVKKETDCYASSSPSSYDSPPNYAQMSNFPGNANSYATRNISGSTSPSPPSTSLTPSDNSSCNSDPRCDTSEHINKSEFSKQDNSPIQITYISKDSFIAGSSQSKSKTHDINCNDGKQSGKNSSSMHGFLTGTYQLAGLHTWNPQPFNPEEQPRVASSISTSSIREFVRHGCPHSSAQRCDSLHGSNYSGRSETKDNPPNKVCPENYISCIRAHSDLVNTSGSQSLPKGISRSTSMPVNSLRTSLHGDKYSTQLQSSCNKQATPKEDDEKSNLLGTRRVCITDF